MRPEVDAGIVVAQFHGGGIADDDLERRRSGHHLSDTGSVLAGEYDLSGGVRDFDPTSPQEIEGQLPPGRARWNGGRRYRSLGRLDGWRRRRVWRDGGGRGRLGSGTAAPRFASCAHAQHLFANPAVTVARMLSDSFAGIKPSSAPMFVLMQLLGAAIAAVLIRFLYGTTNGDTT